MLNCFINGAAKAASPIRTDLEVKKMRKINADVYEFNELSQYVQGKVIDRYRNELSNLLADDLKNVMDMELNNHTHNLNFELAYSLGYCQGDGVSFTGSVDGKEKLLTLAGLVYDNKIPKNILRLINWNIIYKIDFARSNYHYVHKYSVQINIIDNYNTNKDYCHINRAITEFEKAINKWYLNMCDNLEKFGYDTIENLYGDDNIRCYIDENGLEFFLDGSDYNC